MRKSNKSDKNNFANVLSYQYAIHWHFMVTENETENMETKKQSGIECTYLNQYKSIST